MKKKEIQNCPRHSPWPRFCCCCCCCFFVKRNYIEIIKKQLLTIVASDMMWCRPESTNINLVSAWVNIGTLSSTSHHIRCLNSPYLYNVKCLNSQQLFNYIFSLIKKATTTTTITTLTKYWLWPMSWTVLNYLLCIIFCNYNCRQRRPKMPHNVAFHQGLHC